MLASSPTFADQPGFVPGHMLATHVANALWRPISDPHAHGGKACRQPTFRAAAPADRAPGCASEHCLRCDRFAVGDVSPSVTAATCHGIKATSPSIDLLDAAEYRTAHLYAVHAHRGRARNGALMP